MPPPRLPVLCLAGLLAVLSAARAAVPDQVEFNRDIRVLLSDNCLACHGPDANTRKARLRLDTKEGLFGETRREGPVVKPGDPEGSALWKRIVDEDPNAVMPPPDSHKQLTAEQREVFRRWIAQGAHWQGHWAFEPPRRPPVPELPAPHSALHSPIDAFVAAQLASRGLSMNPEADRRTLVRRVTLDLTGLPPTPAEMAAAVEDPSPDWYDQLVRRLLDSPRYGEHRARYWLDAARYADTHGLHFDNYREMWPYRDWVIEAFNRNLPFDQFVLEQLAGDLLENPTLDQLVATGFQRCNMTTNEGGTIEEENLAYYANDRVSTVGTVLLGLTLNCAACHDHKFDPVSMRDFYSMAAFFRNTTQNGFDGNALDGREPNGVIVVPQTPEDRARWAALPGEIEAARRHLTNLAAAATVGVNAWRTAVPAAELRPLGPLPGEMLRVPFTEPRGATNLAWRRADAAETLPVPAGLGWRDDGPLGPAPVLAKESVVDLGDVADFGEADVFSVALWVRVPEQGDGAILSRMSPGEEHLRGWDLFASGDEYAVHLVHRWAPDAVRVATTGGALKRGQWQHVAFTYGGTRTAGGVTIYVDGEPAGLNRGKDNLAGPIRTRAPLRLGARSGGEAFARLALQDVRIFDRVVLEPELRALAAGPRVAGWLAAGGAEGDERRARALEGYFLVTRAPEWRAAAERLAALETERSAIRGRSPLTHVQVERKDSKPVAHILFRGQYDQPRDEVEAGSPAALHPWPEGAPRNRLGLAKWILAEDNPLFARVTVNRFWQELFGAGLVRTSEDFGIMGENPSHPELLDWLAVEFKESGWDVKRLFRLLVTSAAYRQSARVTPEKLERDPANRLLSRGPRFRMDAEMVRDYALAAAGLVDRRIGGPSVRPYQPDGVWEAVAMPESNTRYYRRDDGEALYRRSLYTFWKRAAPPAFMDVFNAPNREVCTVRRERTNTPLQALATLNDPQLVEAARHLAAAALAEGEGDAARALERLADRVLLRPLNDDERAILVETLGRFAFHYAGAADDARALTAVGASPAPAEAPAPQLAALTLLANQLLNLDETLNK